MTCIANYPSKKAFREAVATNPETVAIYNPAIVDQWHGNVQSALTRYGEFTVTNHPKRSWFARVWRKAPGPAGIRVD